MAGQGKSLRLVAGVAQLGNWNSYKLVLYRLYYEDRGGHRMSILIPSRLGFLAVATGLARVTGADHVTLSLITPLTLAAIEENSKSSQGTLGRVRTTIAREFCGNVINGIRKTVSPEESGKYRDGKIIDVSISECKEDHCRLALKISKGETRKNKEKDKESKDKKEPVVVVEEEVKRGEIKPVLIIKDLIVKGSNTECRNGDWKDLPQICSYDCELHYDVCDCSGEEVERDRKVNLTLHIIAVPLNMAVALRNGNIVNIVLFRERNPEELNMEFVLRASILEGLTHSLLKDIEEKVKGRLSDLTNLDITLFYDTTCGSNAIIPPLTHAVKSLDNMVALRIASALLESLNAGNGNELPTVSLRTYFYNSDPALGRLNESDFFKMTVEEGGISYYYRKLVDATLPLGSPSPMNGDELRRKVGGLIDRMTGIRGLVDELISLIPADVSGLNDIERKAVKYILLAYLAKLGLFHWVVASAEKPDLTSEPIKLVELRISENEGEGSKRILKVTYKRSQHYRGLDPYTLVAGLEVCGSLASYLLTLYEAFSRFDGHRGGGSSGNHKVCLTLEALRNLLESVGQKAGTAMQYPLNLLTLSTLYEGVVDPSARITLLNEITRLMRDPKSVLSYFVPKFLRRRMKQNIRAASLPEKVEEVYGERVICLYPMTRLQPTINNVRNFIAHGGLTRLSNDWCIAVKGSSTGNTAKCVTHAICIDRPLPDDVLLKIIKLVS